MSARVTALSMLASCVVVTASLAGAHVYAQARPTRPPAPPRRVVPPVSPNVAPDSTHPYQPGVDVTHYAFALTLPRSGKTIEARATVHVSRRVSVDTLVLDLMRLSVDSVRVGGKARAYLRDSATVRIPLLPTDGLSMQVVVAYRGEPSDGLIITEDASRGWSAFGDNWPNRGRYWLPTVDHPSDKATVSWTILAPSALTIVGNGVQKSRVALAEGLTRTVYEIAAPIPTYVMVVAAAQMVATPLVKTCATGTAGRCVPQNVYTFPNEAAYAPGPFREAAKIVEYFARTVGPYAYEQLNHLQSATRFGGMENATAIFYSDGAFKNRNVGLQLIAHETAHQWFGDAVTPRRWQDLWLSEGFASYFAPLYLRHSEGDSAFRSAMRRMRDEIVNDAVVATRPVVDSVGASTPLTLLNANSYQKGAFVLHMLRADIGDSAFFQGVRDYQRQYRNGTATTDHLRVALEKRAGASLTAFFHQWLHRPGYADLTIGWSWNAATRVVTFTVRQGAPFGPFAVPLVVAFRDAAGKEELHTLHINGDQTQVIPQPISLIGAPTTIVLDPGVELLAKLTLVPDGPAIERSTRM